MQIIHTVLSIKQKERDSFQRNVTKNPAFTGSHGRTACLLTKPTSCHQTVLVVEMLIILPLKRWNGDKEKVMAPFMPFQYLYNTFFSPVEIQTRRDSVTPPNTLPLIHKPIQRPWRTKQLLHVINMGRTTEALPIDPMIRKHQTYFISVKLRCL